MGQFCVIELSYLSFFHLFVQYVLYAWAPLRSHSSAISARLYAAGSVSTCGFHMQDHAQCADMSMTVLFSQNDFVFHNSIMTINPE